MNLLVTTQAVDLDDPVLGFSHRWVEELSKRSERVTVICLKEGRHHLASNVRVLSLGKERGGSRLRYVWSFYRYIFLYRREYDAVFVHMNPEYVVLGGMFWRLARKRIVLWYTHKQVSWRLRVATVLANVVCTAAPQSFRLATDKLRVIGHGIDTDTFSLSAENAPSRSILFFGRLDEVKHPDVFLQALEQLHERGVPFSARIVGDPTDPASPFAHALRGRATALTLEGVLQMQGAVHHSDAPALFAAHAIYVNLTPSGSFDKTVGEAFGCGCIVVSANETFRGILPDALLVDAMSPDSVASGIERALSMDAAERVVLRTKEREFVTAHHSLSGLADTLIGLLSS